MLQTVVKGIKQQIALTASNEAQAALAGIVSSIENAGKIADQSLGFATAVSRCKLVELPETLIKALIDFRGHMLSGVVEALVLNSTKGTTWKPLCDATAKAIASIEELPQMSVHADRTWETLWPLAKDGMEFKTLVNNLEVAKSSENPEEYAMAVSSTLTAMRAVDDRLKGIDSEDESVSSHVVKAHQHMTDCMATSSESVHDHTVAAKALYLKELAKAKSKLDRVAGGTDDGKKWKANISEDESATSPAMVAALKILEVAYVDACQRRLKAVKEALWYVSHRC